MYIGRAFQYVFSSIISLCFHGLQKCQNDTFASSSLPYFILAFLKLYELEILSHWIAVETEAHTDEVTCSRSPSWYMRAKCFKLYLSKLSRGCYVNLSLPSKHLQPHFPHGLHYPLFPSIQRLTQQHCPVTDVSTKPSEAERGLEAKSPASILPTFLQIFHLALLLLLRKKRHPYPIEKGGAATETQLWSIKRALRRGSDDHAQWKSFLLKAKRGRN